MPKLKNWGGSRPGAGRPMAGQGKRQITTFALEPALLAALERYAKQADISRNEAVNRLLSERLLSDRSESVQTPLIDTPAPESLSAMIAAIERETGPALPLCQADVLDMPPETFGQWFVDTLIPCPLEQQAQFKGPWMRAPEGVLNGFKHYGPELIDAIKTGKVKLSPPQAKGLGSADEPTRRKALLDVAGIEL